MNKKIYVLLLIIIVISPIILYTNSKIYHSINEINDKIFNGDKRIIKQIDKFIYELDITRPIQKVFTSDKEKFIDIKLSRSDLDNIEKRKKIFSEEESIIDSQNDWRAANILINRSLNKVDYKIHGTSITPLIRGGISLRIKHKGNGPYYKNSKDFKLISPFDDPDLFTIVLNNIASNNGLIALKRDFVTLRINGQKIGLHQFEEHHSKEWFEKKAKLTNYTLIKSNDDWDNKKHDQHIDDADLWIQNKEYKTSSNEPGVALAALDNLLEAIRSRDAGNIKEFIDLEYFAKFVAWSSIINNNHQVTGDNLKYIYDHTSGKFSLIFRIEDGMNKLNYALEDFSHSWLNKPEFYKNSDTHELFKILLKDSEFIKLKNNALLELVSQKQKIINEALRIYNELYLSVVLNSSSIPRHKIKYDKVMFFEAINYNINKAREYLNHNKIFITATIIGDITKLEIINDSFSDIYIKKITSKSVLNKNKDESIFVNKVIKANLIDDDFKQITLPETIILNSYKNIDYIEILNMLDSKLIPEQHIYLNYKTELNKFSFQESIKTLKDNKINYEISDELILIKKNSYEIHTNLVFPKGYLVHIEKGSRFKISKNISILIRGDMESMGTVAEPITVTSMDPSEPFGVFAIYGEKDIARVNISNFQIGNGSSSIINGVTFLGQLSIHNANIEATNMLVKNSVSDDGINIRNSNIKISSSVFEFNSFDQLDLDFCRGEIVDNIFRKNGDIKINDNGDGLDVSGSKIIIKSNKFVGFSDKGLSIGENSVVLVTENIFNNNNNAITVKDGSSLFLLETNIFNGNAGDLHMYIKKQFYNAPNAFLSTNASKIKIINNSGSIKKLNSDELVDYFDRYDYKS